MWVTRTGLLLVLIAGSTDAVMAQGTQRQPNRTASTQVSCDGSFTDYLGIKVFHCQGGSCLVNGRSATVNERLSPEIEDAKRQVPGAWAFSVEPRLWGIERPAAGRVFEGDVLVAVDGDPITTRRGAMRLADVEPGRPVMLTVRRTLRSNGVAYDVLMDVDLEPRRECGKNVAASAGPAERPGRGGSTAALYGSTAIIDPLLYLAGNENPGIAGKLTAADYLSPAWSNLDVSAGIGYLEGAKLEAGSFRYGTKLEAGSARYGSGTLSTVQDQPKRLAQAKSGSLRWESAQPLNSGIFALIETFPGAAARTADVVRFDGLGLVLTGAKEITVDAEGELRWRFTTQPRVSEVIDDGRAARAGIRTGEYIMMADEKSLTTPEGAAALAGGSTARVTLWVRSGDAARQIIVR